MSKETKQILYRARGKNSRISIFLDGTVTPPLIIVETKRLNDFKKRAISSTSINYSVETFILLKELFRHALEDNFDFKKIINPHTKFDKWSVETNIFKGDDGK